MSILEFFMGYAEPNDFRDKLVLEVGSRYVNGSVRPFVERFTSPKEYVGVDMAPGKYVDMVVPVEDIVERFGKESFDVVITTELLEHIRDWKAAIVSMKRLLRQGGIIYLTTRSCGFPYHAHPYDFWRFSIEDMRKIFEDFDILRLEPDLEDPGIFLRARKPENFRPINLASIPAFSMVTGKRTAHIPDQSDMPFSRRLEITAMLLALSLRHLVRRMQVTLSQGFSGG